MVDCVLPPKPWEKPQMRRATLRIISAIIPHLKILLSFIIRLKWDDYFFAPCLVRRSIRQMEESSMSMVRPSIFARM